MIINRDSDHSRKYGQFSNRRGKKCGIRLHMECNSSTELKKRLLPLGWTFLSAEMNCILHWNLWVASSFLINSFRFLLFPRKCQHFKIWHFKGIRAFGHQITYMLIKISSWNVTKISETKESTFLPTVATNCLINKLNK